ncbi:glycosyltransferase family 4 protein [Sphingomonas sp. 179-A 2A2 NHS]|uniref:glycosyltransferase family 4 protein n=1 Tax=Sphingomonas sp. 179-A 2A2 NHS TaxID=3374290 RepID=UPI0038792692
MTTIFDEVRRRETSLRDRIRRKGSSLAGRLLPRGVLPGTIEHRIRHRLAAGAADRRFYGAGDGFVAGRPKALLVSQDMSASGAPALLLEIARTLVAGGWDVMVWSLAPGAMVERFTTTDIPVVLDGVRGLRQLAPSLGASFDIAICNTAVTQAAVTVLAPHVPILWYLHEVSALETLVNRKAFRQALALPRFVWAGSELSARVVRAHRADVQVVPYGLSPIAAEPLETRHPGVPARLAVFGSYEMRKGQDLLINAYLRLSATQQTALSIDFYGRVLDPAFHAQLHEAAASHPQLGIHGELDLQGYHDALTAADAVVVPSRDDTLPLVSLDALGAGRVLMCTATTGTAAYIESGKTGFVAAEPTAEALARMLEAALAQGNCWCRIAAAGRSVFDHAFSPDAFASMLLTTCTTIAGREIA